MDRDAGDLARRVEAGDVGATLVVGLDAAHRVVVAGLDVDRLLGDVDAGEVAADEDDLAEGLVDALARDHGDVERDRPVGEAAALVDLGLLGAGDDVAGGELHLVGRVALHEALAVGVQQVSALAAGALGDQEALARRASSGGTGSSPCPSASPRRGRPGRCRRRCRSARWWSGARSARCRRSRGSPPWRRSAPSSRR